MGFHYLMPLSIFCVSQMVEDCLDVASPTADQRLPRERHAPPGHRLGEPWPDTLPQHQHVVHHDAQAHADASHPGGRKSTLFQTAVTASAYAANIHALAFQRLRRALPETPDPRLLNRLARPAVIIDPLMLPPAFDRIVNDSPKFIPASVEIRHIGSSHPHRYDLAKVTDDKRSGFYAWTYVNRRHEHAVTFMNGTDQPFVKSRFLGRTLLDVGAVLQSTLGLVSAQLDPAQEHYLEASRLRGVRSHEIVGFSLSSTLANDLSARLGAAGTIYADLGIAQPPKWMRAWFPELHAQTYTPQEMRRPGQRITSLSLRNDPVEALVGHVPGRRIRLNNNDRGGKGWVDHYISTFGAAARRWRREVGPVIPYSYGDNKLTHLLPDDGNRRAALRDDRPEPVRARRNPASPAPVMVRRTP